MTKEGQTITSEIIWRMAKSQQGRQECTFKWSQSTDMDMKKILAELGTRAEQINVKISEIEQAKLVSQETLRMEFNV